MNLLPELAIRDIERDLSQGDGNELAGKFRAPHSSSALAVNTFALFRKKREPLPLLGAKCLRIDGFEKKCPHGLPSNKSPNLDMVATAPGKVIGIESKFLEFLRPKPAEFSPMYREKMDERRKAGGWYRHMLKLMAASHTYCCLDAAQLIKHAYGLANCYPHDAVTLLYLFWEPSDADMHPIFVEHRAEAETFKREVRDDQVSFEFMSYPELWARWDALPGAPSWLPSHVKNLRQRYALAIRG